MVWTKPTAWPPPTWDEGDLHRHKETRLPQKLHPFEIERGDDGLWTLTKSGKKLHTYDVLQTGIEGIFPAFRAMLDAYEAWFPTRPAPRVYFIGTKLVTGKTVKIGYSLDPERRLADLQVAHAERLHIFATVEGDRNLEAKYHSRWRSRHRGGEWFTLGDCIINEINRLNAAPLSRGRAGA